jgi:hypothetical protein
LETQIIYIKSLETRNPRAKNRKAYIKYLGTRNPRAKNRKAYTMYKVHVFRSKKPKGQK